MYLPTGETPTATVTETTRKSVRDLPKIQLQPSEYTQGGIFNIDVPDGATMSNLPKIRIVKPKKHKITEILPLMRSHQVKKALNHLTKVEASFDNLVVKMRKEFR